MPIRVTPISPDEFAEVVAQIGYAVWQIQTLEAVLTTHLVLVHKANQSTARTEVEKMFAKAEKNTLGQLFHGIKDSPTISQSLLRRLEAFVDERNWLIHRSNHENHADLYSEPARSALFERICNVAEEALALLKEFQRATEKYLVDNQIMTKVEIDARAADMLREWARSST